MKASYHSSTTSLLSGKYSWRTIFLLLSVIKSLWWFSFLDSMSLWDMGWGHSRNGEDKERDLGKRPSPRKGCIEHLGIFGQTEVLWGLWLCGGGRQEPWVWTEEEAMTQPPLLSLESQLPWMNWVASQSFNKYLWALVQVPGLEPVSRTNSKYNREVGM